MFQQHRAVTSVSNLSSSSYSSSSSRFQDQRYSQDILPSNFGPLNRFHSNKRNCVPAGILFSSTTSSSTFVSSAACHSTANFGSGLGLSSHSFLSANSTPDTTSTLPASRSFSLSFLASPTTRPYYRFDFDQKTQENLTTSGDIAGPSLATVAQLARSTTTEPIDSGSGSALTIAFTTPTPTVTVSTTASISAPRNTSKTTAATTTPSGEFWNSEPQSWLKLAETRLGIMDIITGTKKNTKAPIAMCSSVEGDDWSFHNVMDMDVDFDHMSAASAMQIDCSSPLMLLPDDILSACISRLSAQDLGNLEMVNTRFRHVIQNDIQCWRAIVKSHWNSYWDSSNGLLEAAVVHAGSWKNLFIEKFRHEKGSDHLITACNSEVLAMIQMIKGNSRFSSKDKVLSTSPSSIMPMMQRQNSGSSKDKVPLSVVILIDGSSSVTEDDFKSMKGFSRKLLLSLEESHPESYAAVVQFNQYPRVECELAPINGGQNHGEPESGILPSTGSGSSTVSGTGTTSASAPPPAPTAPPAPPRGSFQSPFIQAPSTSTVPVAPGTANSQTASNHGLSPLNVVQKLNQMMGSTDLHAPIKKCHEILRADHRPTDKVVVFLTDGQTHAEELNATVREASEMVTSIGARFYSIGVGRDVDEKGLKRVCLGNENDRSDLGNYFTLRRRRT